MDTACTLLDNSISLDEYELRQKSLEFISKHTYSVINTAAFMSLSRGAIDDVVGLDMLSVVSERLLYEGCVKWARHQLRQLGNEDPSDEDIRDKLGSVLYKIRFPTMTQQEFAEIASHSKILSSEEKLDVFVSLATGEKLETLMFLSHSRCRVSDNIIRRFTAVTHVQPSWTCNGVKADAICIETTVDMFLTGVGLYGGGEPSTFDVKLTILKECEILSTTVIKMTSDGSRAPVKILLEHPVHIHVNTRYTVAALIKGPLTWAGTNGQTSCDLSGVGQITFSDAGTANGSCVRCGQIPMLFYCL